MRIKRIEIDGTTGHLAIERQIQNARIRIDSIICNPNPGQQAWQIWDLPAAISDEELFKVATAVQHRTDGCIGTYLMVLEYFVEMQKFQK
ncbi:MAG: hypothetical protein FWD53_13350 [Phycisphaerales bacterium]|nr:hypothetical protein [Phycisphaerales bacterium]